MGTAERIPLDREPLKATDPRDRAIIDYASQPPIGCRYVDTSTTYTNCVVTVSTTLDFIAATGVQYDPYNLIDITADSVRIPQSGVWDIAFEVQFAAAAAAGDHLYAQFGQGAFTVSGLVDMVDDGIARAAGEFKRLAVSLPYYVPQSTLGNGDLFYIRAVSLGSTNDAKIISFSMWLRSAVIPSRY